MKTDRVFVLLLVVLLPLSGCMHTIDEAEGESPEAQNMLPVIYGGIDLTASCPIAGGSCSSGDWIYPVLSSESKVIDFDGTVMQFGLDLDLDSEIDFLMPFTIGSGYTEYDFRVNLDFKEFHINPVLWDPSGLSADNPDAYCYQWVNIVAVDDDGGKTIQPNVWVFDWDVESQYCNTSYDYD